MIGLFVMDTLTSLIVYYTELAKDIPFPPPQTCTVVIHFTFDQFILMIFMSCQCVTAEIARLIRKAKLRAPLLSPRVIYARPFTMAADTFERYLLEDGITHDTTTPPAPVATTPATTPAGGFNSLSFAQFHELISRDVVQSLNAS
jgi:hypothetical protein